MRMFEIFFFSVSDKILIHNCGSQDNIEHLTQLISAEGCLKLCFEKQFEYLCLISAKQPKNTVGIFEFSNFCVNVRIC